jgi:hypothetical protein
VEGGRGVWKKESMKGVKEERLWVEVGRWREESRS